MKVVGPDGEELPPGEVGEIFMRSADGANDLPIRRRGRAHDCPAAGSRSATWARSTPTATCTSRDRQTDMILVGGSNVYPAEVEAALDEHPRVPFVRGDRSARTTTSGAARTRSCRPTTARPIDDAELRVHLGERLVRYKIPRTFEFIAEPLRDDAGKLRRSALRAERVGAEHL